jgi:hypothetical protein
MSDPVFRLIEAIDRKGAQGIRDAYPPGARLVAMTPNTFQVATGAEDIAEHRMYRCGPREGAPELAGAYTKAAS